MNERVIAITAWYAVKLQEAPDAARDLAQLKAQARTVSANRFTVIAMNEGLIVMWALTDWTDQQIAATVQLPAQSRVWFYVSAVPAIAAQRLSADTTAWWFRHQPAP